MNRYDLVLLGFIAEKESSGYDIITTIKHRELDRWAKISTSTVYNPATGRTNGTTPNFFATMAVRPPKIVDRPHRHAFLRTVDQDAQLRHTQ